jgi:hypothetical protein
MKGVSEYDIKLDKKIKYCIENSYKIIVSDNCDYIIENIKLKK